MGDLSFAEKVAERRAALEAAGIKATVKPDKPTFEQDLIPELEKNTRTEESLEIDDIIGRVGIVDAYIKWCGKMVPNPGGKTESIMVSCPKPEHPDARPSAWLNSDKDTWYCAKCEEGGDVYDIYAVNHGWDSSYKTAEKFPKMRREMAQTLGYTVTRTPGGQNIVVQQKIVHEPESVPVTARVTPAVVPADEPVATVTALPTAVPDLDDAEIEYPEIAWRSIIPTGTFLHRWMQVTMQDDLPEEFYFWLGMQALGFACGRDVVLTDNPTVRPNLYVCLFGRSGQGKSRAASALTEILQKALPMEWDNPNTKGVTSVSTPGSAEALVDSFSWPQYDPADPKKIAYYAGIRGLIRFDELSSLVGRAQRVGNPIKPTLMEFYDGYTDVEVRSRGAGAVKAVDHFAQLLTTTQPRAIRSLLNQADVDSGFINRVVFASGREKDAVAYGREKLDIDSTVDPLKAIRAWGGFGRNLILDGDALELWTKFFKRTLEPSRKNDETNLLTRTDLTLKKCMVLLSANAMEASISVSTVESVIKIWDYLLKSYRILGGDIGMGVMDECRRDIMQAVTRYKARTGNNPSLREIKRALSTTSHPMDMISKTIGFMVQFNELEEINHKPLRGPATVRYSYVS